MKILKLFKAAFKILTNKNFRCIVKANYGFYNSLSDEVFIKKIFRASIGKDLNLENPRTFNEKLQWLKLYNHNPQYTTLVDKFLVRNFVKDKIGNSYLIPLLGVWDNPDDIDFDKLPEQFVLKCNHNSGLGMCICKNKLLLNITDVKQRLKKGLRENYYLKWREWPYKNVPRKIIAEQFMVDESGTELKDYKFFCFNGKPEFLYVATDRPSNTKFDFFDTNFEHLPFKQGHPWATKLIKKPANFEKMLQIAAKLSEGIPYVRVDLYNINGKIYFGEMTFFQLSGFVPFDPVEWDFKLGSMLVLPAKKSL